MFQRTFTSLRKSACTSPHVVRSVTPLEGHGRGRPSVTAEDMFRPHLCHPLIHDLTAGLPLSHLPNPTSFPPTVPPCPPAFPTTSPLPPTTLPPTSPTFPPDEVTSAFDSVRLCPTSVSAASTAVASPTVAFPIRASLAVIPTVAPLSASPSLRLASASSIVDASGSSSPASAHSGLPNPVEPRRHPHCRALAGLPIPSLCRVHRRGLTHGRLPDPGEPRRHPHRRALVGLPVAAPRIGIVHRRCVRVLPGLRHSGLPNPVEPRRHPHCRALAGLPVVAPRSAPSAINASGSSSPTSAHSRTSSPSPTPRTLLASRSEEYMLLFRLPPDKEACDQFRVMNDYLKPHVLPLSLSTHHH
ncbi:hypothetical protein ZEAMMB73_Zm00001d014114 [Zea mays]|uniref:Uncharacterized protein n=2 Tax=Zea mays TaxID=4577 RepID=A0A1D6GQ20_MAIZE|nr:hypothetical protein ZEAMMB73_Zm00001d014114 [Zea mays]